MSYFEWRQNLDNERWELDEVNGRLQAVMNRAVDTVVGRLAALRSADGARPDGPPDLRTAAFVTAIERIARVTLQRGIWP